MKLNKLDFRNLIIAIVIVIIVFNVKYHKNVNYVINFNIHSNLYETERLLHSLDNKLSNYQNDKISKEEFQNLLSKCQGDLGFNIYSTAKYSHISKRLKYVNIKKLDYYIRDLSLEEFSDEEELEFHKENLLEICKLWREINIDLSINYFYPSPELKKILIKTEQLSEKGYNQIRLVEEKQ